MYKESDAVILATAVSAEPAQVFDDGFNTLIDGQKVKLKIDRWFKGYKAGGKLTLDQPNSSCDWRFDIDDLNVPVLLYLKYDKERLVYSIKTCGRSRKLPAPDDISWLNHLPGSLTRTYVSGTVKLNDGSHLFPPVAGVTVWIKSAKHSPRRLVTDRFGHYRVWDLAPGEYSITVVLSEMFELAWTTSVPDGWQYFWSPDRQDQRALSVTLSANSTAGVDFMLKKKAKN